MSSALTKTSTVTGLSTPRPVTTPRGNVGQNTSRRTFKLARHVTKATDQEEMMRQAEARWENQIRTGKVKNVTPVEAGELLKGGEWVLLDVRPPEEIAKAAIEGAVEVPLFVVDEDRSPAGLLKQLSTIATGGWWLGGYHMRPNTLFLNQVMSKVPADAKVIVACQKGLRSLAACEQLSRVGFSTIAWINGGFDTARPGDLPTKGGKDIRYGGIGGLSEVLGWTEVQRQSLNGGFMGGSTNVLKVFAVILAIDLLWLGSELSKSGAPLPIHLPFFGLE